MIDAESSIYSEVETKILSQFPKAFVTGEYVPSPPSFPCVSLVEVDNSTFRDSQTEVGRENHAVIMYEFNVYSNKTSGKKTECRKIAACVDEALMNLNFTRMMFEPVTNLNDPTIFRMIGRYRAVISKDYMIYRR